MDFEHPKLPLGTVFNQVPITNAIPGWSAFPTNVQGEIFYNSSSIGGALVALVDRTALGYSAIQGNYSVLLQGSTFSHTPDSASIWQTGQIPQNAQSLTFLTRSPSSLQAIFDGQLIPMMEIGSGPNYIMMGGNISAFAGKTGELRFTALGNVGSGLIDDIQFSTLPIPEPSVITLSGLGLIAFAFRFIRPIF